MSSLTAGGITIISPDFCRCVINKTLCTYNVFLHRKMINMQHSRYFLQHAAFAVCNNMRQQTEKRDMRHATGRTDDDVDNGTCGTCLSSSQTTVEECHHWNVTSQIVIFISLVHPVHQLKLATNQPSVVTTNMLVHWLLLLIFISVPSSTSSIPLSPYRTPFPTPSPTPSLYRHHHTCRASPPPPHRLPTVPDIPLHPSSLPTPSPPLPTVPDVCLSPLLVPPPPHPSPPYMTCLSTPPPPHPSPPYLTCLSQFAFVVKANVQARHWYGRSPLCVRSCLSSVLRSALR